MRVLIVDHVDRADGVLTPMGAVEPSIDLEEAEHHWRRGTPASGAGGLVEVNAAKLLAVKARGRRRWSLREALFEDWGAMPVSTVVRRGELCTGLTSWLIAFDPRVPAYYVLRRPDLEPRAAVVEEELGGGALVDAVTLSTGIRIGGVREYVEACRVFDSRGPHPRVLLGLTVAALTGMSVEEAVGAVLRGRVGGVAGKRISLFTEHAWSFYGWRLMAEGWRKIDVHRFYEKILV